MYVHALKAGLDERRRVAASHRLGQSIMGRLRSWTSAGGGCDVGRRREQSAVRDSESGGRVAHDVRSACRFSGGVPSVRRTPHSRRNAFWTTSRARRKKIRTRCVAKLLSAKHARHRAVLDLVADKAGWKKRGPKMKSGASRCMVVQFCRRAGRATEARRWRLEVAQSHLRRRLWYRGKPEHRRDADGIGYRLRSCSGVDRRDYRQGRPRSSRATSTTTPVLRMNQMPAIDVHIVPSSAKPTGVGEPGTPVIAPALANALLGDRKAGLHAALSAQGITLG